MSDATYCVGCDAQLSPRQRQGNPRKWCSEVCRVRWIRNNRPDYRQRQAKRAAEQHRQRMDAKGGAWAATIERSCTECGTVFMAKRKDTKYCSKRCSGRVTDRKRRALGRKKHPVVRRAKVCGWCDHQYTTSRLIGSYCSNRCAAFGNGSARLACDLTWQYCKPCGLWRSHGLCPQRDTHPRTPPPDMSPRPCASCGTEFIPTRPAGYFAVYCSKQCRNREARARRRSTVGTDYVHRTDRAIGRVRRYAIYERDGWRCQLCKRKVDPTLTVPHPMAATLDHIVPVSLGGTHEPANLQLAHFSCNSKKRNKVHGSGEQLRLVG